LRTVDANVCHGARILHTYIVRTRSVSLALRRYNGCVRGSNTPGCHRYPVRVLRTAARIRREILATRGLAQEAARSPGAAVPATHALRDHQRVGGVACTDAPSVRAASCARHPRDREAASRQASSAGMVVAQARGRAGASEPEPTPARAEGVTSTRSPAPPRAMCPAASGAIPGLWRGSPVAERDDV